MDMKMTSPPLKYIKYISIACLLTYSTHPFINGIGCNFHAQSNEAKISFYTTCKFGLIDSVVQNNLTKKSVKLKGLYGKSGNTIFFVTYKTEIFPQQKEEFTDITELYTTNRFFVSKIIRNSDGTDWVLLQYPYFTIHKSKHIGSLSFL